MRNLIAQVLLNSAAQRCDTNRHVPCRLHELQDLGPREFQLCPANWDRSADNRLEVHGSLRLRCAKQQQRIVIRRCLALQKFGELHSQ